jgi:hypothetical protein
MALWAMSIACGRCPTVLQALPTEESLRTVHCCDDVVYDGVRAHAEFGARGSSGERRNWVGSRAMGRDEGFWTRMG